MEKYFATQIIAGRLDYATVVKKYPKYQKKIDAVLEERGYRIDEDGNCVPVE